MSDVAVRIEGLSKEYKIGNIQKRYSRLGDQMVDAIVAPFRRLGNLIKGDVAGASELTRSFWALNDVSFEIKHGDILGVIGHNGAGKSTLLKILSRITGPTTGTVDIYGRVGSLLEVGTGFHPELTGRENVYLNGSILGMKRAEITRKFDEIVDFAGVEKFIDTPVKHYSSGMYVRLAFSVAAHLEPEILLIDEVLAVGDVDFQKKSLGKMENVSQQGRTVIFVSHNINALQRLCAVSVLLDHGRLLAKDTTTNVIKQYLSVASTQSAGPGQWIDTNKGGREGSGKVRFDAISYTSRNQTVLNHPYTGGPIEFSIKLTSDSERSVGSIAVTIFDRYGTKLVNIDTLALGKAIQLRKGENQISLKVDQLYLNPGIYNVNLWIADPPSEVYDHVSSVTMLEVMEVEKSDIRVQSDGVIPVHFEIADGK